MPSLADTLGSIPGYAGYTAARARNQQQEQAELQQAMGLQGLMAQMQKAQAEQQTRAVLEQSGGDPEAAVNALIKSGNLQGAQQLAPLAKMAQERRQAEETRKGLAGLMTPQGSPEGPVAAPSRIDALKKMSVMYANNPVVMQRIQAEIDKLETAAAQPPRKRDRIEGDTLIQEEFVDGAFREVGRGPRFSSQVGTPKERMVSVRLPDGRVVYKRESDAEGMEVGGRVTDTNLPKAVQQLGRDFEKANLPTTIAVLENAETITPEMAAWLTGPGQMVPDRLAPPDAVTARQNLAKLFNITLKDRSGAAVTYQELERLKEEFGKGLLRTPESLLNAIKTARGIVEKHYQSIAATHGKDALDKYNENLESIGGRPFKANAQPTAVPTPKPAAAGGPYSDPDKEKRYQEWKARQKK